MAEVAGARPHEIVEVTTGETGPDRRERVFELVAVAILAFATLAAAWSGYQAARWDGVEASMYAKSGAADADAAKATTQVNRIVLIDAALFNEWLSAKSAGNTALMSWVEGRFREEYRAAFNAWIALDPFNNPAAPSEPAEMPQYAVAVAAKSDALSAVADAAIHEGEHAKEISDEFILNTVFLASALFLAGISSRFDWRAARIVVLLIAGGALGWAVLRAVQLPVA